MEAIPTARRGRTPQDAHRPKAAIGWAPGLAAIALLLSCLLLALVPAVLLPAAPAAAQSLFDQLLTGFEVMIGESVAANVINEYGPPARLSPAKERWVREIFTDVAAQASRNDITYQLTVLESQVVNAFAAPGGYIFITTGLLSHIGNDADALANVLGHEVAHVEHKHGMNTLSRNLGIGLALDLLFGGEKQQGEAVYSAALILTQLLSLGWSREQEHEADDSGQRLAATAGYDPMGMVRFFEVLQQLQGEEVPFLEFLSTHPLTSERIQRARARAAQLGRSEIFYPPGLATLTLKVAASR